ncbi:MAG TPA: energy-coupling factor transporter transmembrane component T [Gemmatimonadales bacterium]|nr:energy-coupling factor transporter transmembrane component T [Gemmatimonadales bacterium]
MRRLHPFTLLALAVALPALAWILPAPWGAAGTLTLAAALLLTPGASPGITTAKTAALSAAPFWFFLYLLHGVGGMVPTGLRLSTMIASFVWLVAILPPARLVEAMVAAGWPVSVAFLFSATLQAVPALHERAQRLVDAQRCRGLATRGGPLVRLRALRALALPLVLSALHEVDERALALETRGLVAGARRTPLAPPADHRAEQALRWLLALSCAALFVWRIA